MNCPECGQKIPSHVKSCPNCGYPINTSDSLKKLKKPKAIIIGIVLIIVVIFLALSYHDAKPTIDAINAIGRVTLESESKIQTAQSKYDHLNSVQKLFVSNKKTLEDAKETFASLPIELTPENARQYFDFNVIFTDLIDKDLSVYMLGMFYHSASANMEVVCTPKTDKYFENASVTLNYNFSSVYSWTAPKITITLDSSGKGSRTEKITYSGMLSPSLPSSTSAYTIVSASGNLYSKKPE